MLPCWLLYEDTVLTYNSLRNCDIFRICSFVDLSLFFDLSLFLQIAEAGYQFKTAVIPQEKSQRVTTQVVQEGDTTKTETVTTTVTQSTVLIQVRNVKALMADK